MSRTPVQERAQKTRDRIMQAALSAFTERGYAASSMEQIAEIAGVTRGPLYHFFDDKLDLFRAVHTEVERELARVIALAVGERMPEAKDALDEVRLGAQAYLDVCQSPVVQQIVLVDAPHVLARGASREVAEFGLELLRTGLRRAMQKGCIAGRPTDPLARVLRAAITEGAIYVARAEDKTRAREEAGAAVDALIEGLRIPDLN